MRFTKRIQDLPTNKNGERQLEPHHLDDNFAAQDDALLTTLGALFAAGGVAVPGTVTLTALALRVQGRTGITLDGRVPVHVDDQTLDLTPLAAGKGLIVMTTDPVTIQRPYTDVVTGESLTDTMNVSAGRLSVIGAGQQGVTLDANGYPVAPSNTVPVSQVTRTAGGATLDSIPNPALTIRAGVGSSGVVSVNGKAGVVTLVPGDIGAAAVADLAAKADLVGDKLATSQLPAIAIGELFPVASQAAMLALTAQIGDVAVRTDLANKRFLLLGTSTTLADWKSIDDVAAGGVTTVNGQSGVVVLAAADVGALAASRLNAANGAAGLGLDGLLLAAQRPPSSGGGLAAVAHDATLTGDGTSASPLSVATASGSGNISLIANNNVSVEQVFNPATTSSNGPNWSIRYNVLGSIAFKALQVNILEAGGYFDTAIIEVHRTDATFAISAGTKLAQGSVAITGSYALSTLTLDAQVTFQAGQYLVLSVHCSSGGSPRIDASAARPLPAPLPLGKLAYVASVANTGIVNANGVPRVLFLGGAVKGVSGPLDPIDFPVVAAVADLPAGAVAVLDPGNAAPRLIRKRADGTVWYGALFTNVP